MRKMKITLERLISNSPGNALEQEIDIMKKWTADETYDFIKKNSPILQSARKHVLESANKIILEDLYSKNCYFKRPYNGFYLSEKLVQEILSLENIVTKFENTEKEAQRLFDYMIEYSS